MQGMIQNFVRSTLSLTFVIAAARVVFNIKARMARETSWQLELKGDLTKQRRVEAVDKLLSVMTLLVSAVFGLQAIGLDGRLADSPLTDPMQPRSLADSPLTELIADHACLTVLPCDMHAGRLITDIRECTCI